MAEYMHELRIPRERIAVLIGKKGETKRHLEELTGTRIEVDSKEGEVFIHGEDALKLYSTKEIVKAIGRGFSPQNATKLLKEEYSFELIDLRDFANSKEHLPRLRGRVIGSNGKARAAIEMLTSTTISVYGKSIGIIGEIQNVAIAKRALESLLEGSTHATVYTWLEKNRVEFKKKELMNL
ncbi:MAG: KH domain-containing protein [Candidatus Woesearchaeota archaeon]